MNKHLINNIQNDMCKYDCNHKNVSNIQELEREYNMQNENSCI